MLAQVDFGGFVDGITEGLGNAASNAATFAPKLIGALIILLVGWFIARIIRNVVEKILVRVGMDRLLERAGFSDTLRNAGHSASGLISKIIYFIALLVVVLMAADALGIESLTTLLAGLIAYMPLVAIAVVIVVVAAAVGSFVAEIAKPWADAQGVPWVAAAARWAFLIIGGFAALNTLNVASDIVNTLFIAVVATSGVAAAIAFGVGGIRPAEAMWRRMLPSDNE